MGLFSTPISGVPYEPPALAVGSAGPRLSNKVLTSTRIPNRFHRLYRLHPSSHSPFTFITKLITIRSDVRVEALLITNPWSWRKSHPLSFLILSSSRYGDSGLDQVGLDCYKEGRYRWIRIPHVFPVSRPRLTGTAGLLKLFPAHAISIASILFFGRRFRGKGGYSSRAIYEWPLK